MQPSRSQPEPSQPATRRANAGKADPPPAMPDAADAVDAVLALVDGTRIADIEVEWNGTHVHVKREPSPAGAAEEEPAHGPRDNGTITVTSMYVGIFHREPASAFPSVGDHVAAGQTIAHVETLRIQNAVISPAEGILAETLVADGTPVEYGQPLVVIRPGAPEDEGEDGESVE